MTTALLLSAVALLCVTAIAAPVSSNVTTSDVTIRQLYAAAWGSLWNESVADDIWSLTLGHSRDTFQTNIKLNLLGSPVVQDLRDAIGIPDDNTFVTPFMLQAFMRAAEARPDLAPLRDDLLAAALNRSMTALNPNAPRGTPSFGFWPFKLDPSTGRYRQRSVNMSPFISNGLSLLNLILLLAKKNSLVYNVSEFLDFQLVTFEYSQNIPADADDTGMYLNTASMFAAHATELPKTNGIWAAQAFDATSIVPLLLKYAYCPLNASDESRSIIDPRSYFWARRFIQNLSHPDDCIITTWMENQPEEMAQWLANEVDTMMPFNVNNIEATVATNSLSGLTALLLANRTEWFNGPAKRLYLTTARFVAWAMQHQPEISRPDFQNLYYPTTMDFVHFFARHLRLLNEFHASGVAWPVAELGEIRDMMSDAFASGGMAYIAKTRATPESCGVENASAATAPYCWNGILGEGDVDANGRPAPSHLDRFFVTASVGSALIDAYTVSVPPGKSSGAAGRSGRVWHADTPAVARACVDGAVAWLLHAANQTNTSYESAFFSGSIHAGNTMPFGYPANVMRYMNTSTAAFSCASTNFSIGVNSLVGVRGIMPDAEFDKIVSSGGCGGWSTNFTFQGFNDPTSPWPYWSCPALTKAIGMKVIAEHSILRRWR